MKDLTKEEKKFLEEVRDNGYLSKDTNGYYRYRFYKKNYKRSRVFVQLYLNKKLEIWEFVHHKDGDKGNDSIENLEIKDACSHNYHHIAGTRGRKYKKRIKTNELSEEIKKKIFELSKKYKFGNHANCSKIARELGISDFTVSRYLSNHSNLP